MAHHRESDITHHRKRETDPNRDELGHAYADKVIAKYGELLREFSDAVAELRRSGVPRAEAGPLLRARFSRRTPPDARLIANRLFVVGYMQPGPAPTTLGM